jgi:predicted XRE-type DNA-binding protein
MALTLRGVIVVEYGESKRPAVNLSYESFASLKSSPLPLKESELELQLRIELSEMLCEQIQYKFPNLTQSQIGKKLHTSQATVSYILKEKYETVSLEKLIHYSACAGMGLFISFQTENDLKFEGGPNLQVMTGSKI